MTRSTKVVTELAKSIREYESDTFSGSTVSHRTSIDMALLMVQDLLIDELGMTIDGVTLDQFCEVVRTLRKLRKQKESK